MLCGVSELKSLVVVYPGHTGNEASGGMAMSSSLLLFLQVQHRAGTEASTRDNCSGGELHRKLTFLSCLTPLQPLPPLHSCLMAV